MRFRALTLVALLSLSLAPVRAAEPIRDPAELLPAGTLACGELRQPGTLFKEFASLLEDSALGNVPDSLARLRGKDDEPAARRAIHEVGAIGLMLSPEMVREAGRLQGAIIALTGFKKDRPEFVAIILPGESNGPGFVMRAFLTLETVRPIQEVEGVKIYQMQKGDEPAMAMLPDALVVGTPDAVADVVRRARGKGKGESLGSVKAYREATLAIGREPGLFGYVDPGATMAAIAKAEAKEAEAVRAIGELVNFKAFRAAAWSMSLDKGTLRYRQLALIDPKEKSPILDLVPTEPARTELLHFTPSDPVLAAVLSNARGAERWAQALKLVDHVARQSGDREVPSEAIAKVEKNLGLDIGKDIMGKIAHIAISLGDPIKAPRKKIETKGENFQSTTVYTELPVALVLEAKDEETAVALVDKVLPKLVGGLLGMEDLKPETKDVSGQKITSLPLKKETAGVHYGRTGKTIVVGPFAQPVAQALANGSAKKGWLADARVKDRNKELEDAVFVAVVKPVSMALSALVPVASGSSVKRDGPKEGKEKPQADEKVGRTVKEEEPIKLPKELTTLMEKQELLVIRVTRDERHIVEEYTLPGLKPIIGPLVDMALPHHTRPNPQKDAPPPDRRN